VKEIHYLIMFGGGGKSSCRRGGGNTITMNGNHILGGLQKVWEVGGGCRDKNLTDEISHLFKEEGDNMTFWEMKL